MTHMCRMHLRSITKANILFLKNNQPKKVPSYMTANEGEKKQPGERIGITANSTLPHFHLCVNV